MCPFPRQRRDWSQWLSVVICSAELECRVGMWRYDAELHFRTAPMEVSPLLLSSLVMPSLAGMDKVTKDTTLLRETACQAFETIYSLTLQGPADDKLASSCFDSQPRRWISSSHHQPPDGAAPFPPLGSPPVVPRRKVVRSRTGIVQARSYITSNPPSTPRSSILTHSQHHGL